MTFNVRTFLLTVLLALAAVTGVAQQVTLSMGSGAGAPGAVVNVNLTMTGGSQAAGLQWRLTPATGISSVAFTASSAATAAGKSLTCNTNGSAIDCVLFGLNSNLLSDGVVATAAVTITSGTPLTAAALALSNVVASSASGTTLAATGTNGSVSISQGSSSPSTYALSGTVSGGAGATVSLSGPVSASTTADSNGNYQFGNLVNGNYTVSANKSGVTISPASQSVTINGGNATANFTAAQQQTTFTLTGTVSGGGGAQVVMLGPVSASTTANANGGYLFVNLVNGTYTVSANKAGLTFSPASQSVTVNNANVTANFTSGQQQSTFTLTGTVSGGGGAQVVMSGPVSASTTADANGNYQFVNLVNGNYTVSANKSGVTISPASQSVTVNNANVTANFTAGQKQTTFTLTGTVSGGGGAQVVMLGPVSASTTADANGSYLFVNLVNGTYTVSANKAGLTFSPASQSVTVNNANVTANFTSGQQQTTYTLTGTVSGGGGAQVVMSGPVSASTTADSNGNYQFVNLVNGNYTVSANKSGVTISPASQAVTVNNANVTANFSATQQQVGTATVSMSSPAGALGTTVNVDLTLNAASGAQPVSLQWRVTPGNGAAATTFTASSAAIAAGKSIQCSPNGTSLDCVLFGMNSTVLPNGVVATAAVTISPTASVTVIPMNLSRVVTSNSGGTSIPTTSTDGNISVTQSPVSTFTLSGTISGGSGATVALTGTAAKSTTADANGSYSFTGLANGSYTVTPTKTGYTMSPVNRAVTINGANVTANFTATQPTWGISGVVSGGTATMTLSGPVSLTTSTDANGNYSLAGLPNGSYTLTPSASGLSFTPANRAITINGSNQTGLNFSATRQTYTISGTISGGAGASVLMMGPVSASTTADSNGNYLFVSLVNGNYTITPTLANRTMTPASRSVTVNGANMPGTNFTATATTTSTSPNVDVTVSRDYSVAYYTYEAPTLSTSSTNELLVAFISTDSTRNAQQVRSVAGGGLNWSLAARANRQSGTAEIWYAFSKGKLSSANISANIAQKATGQITVTAFSNVDTLNSGTSALGGVVSASGASGAPWAPLTPTRTGSLVFAVGNDPSGAVARVPSTGQSLTHQFLVPNTGTMWVQRVDAPVKAGLQIVVGVDSPRGNPYNFSVIEIRGAASSSSAPPPAFDAPSSLTQTSDPQPGSGSGSAPVINAAVMLVHPVTYEPADVCSPGGLATLLGTDFTAQPAQSVVNASLPTKLAGAQVQVNGEYARLVMVAADQIHFLCPNLVPGSPLDITVVTESGKLLRTAMTTMRAAAPALFTKQGSQEAMFQLADSDSQNSASGTARRGETIRLYPTSLGAVDAPMTVGELAPTDRKLYLQNSLKVVINGVDVEPTFAGLAPGAVGLYQVDVQIPANAPVNPEVALSLKLRLADGTEILSNPTRIAIGTAALKDRRQ